MSASTILCSLIYALIVNAWSILISLYKSLYFATPPQYGGGVARK